MKDIIICVVAVLFALVAVFIILFMIGVGKRWDRDYEDELQEKAIRDGR